MKQKTVKTKKTVTTKAKTSVSSKSQKPLFTTNIKFRCQNVKCFYDNVLPFPPKDNKLQCAICQKKYLMPSTFVEYETTYHVIPKQVKR